MTAFVSLVGIALLILSVAGLWMTFTKAGEAGWKSIIPIWNLLVILRIAGREWWWIFLFLIPIVDIVVAILVALDVARNFGRGTGFGLGLAFFAPIWYLILGFGSDTYRGPHASA